MKVIRVISVMIFLFAINSFSQWTSQNSGTTLTLNAVYFTDNTNGTAVGISSKIIRTTDGGATWINQPNPAGQNLWGVHFTNTNTGYVVGDGAIARTTNGGNLWVIQTSPPGNYYGIFMLDINTAYAVGSNGAISKTTNGGINWDSVSSGTTEVLFDVHFPSASTGYAAGYNGLILKSSDNGNNWSQQTSGLTTNLSRVHFLSNDTGYICGDNGKILKTVNGGVNWIQQNSTITDRVGDIYFINSNTGTAVGSNNKILRTTTGGQIWVQQTSGVNEGFNGVCLTGLTTAYCTGSNGVMLYTSTGGFSLPPAPVLVLPVNNATNISLTPTFDWDTIPTSKNYQIQISIDTAFSSPLFDTTTILTSHTLRSGLLTNNVSYFWRVRGINIVGNGPWSVVFRFTTIVALPLAPNLLIPVNNASNVSLTPFFDWDSTSPATFYRLQVSSDSTFEIADVDVTGITVSYYQITSPPIQSNTRYYWRVSATNAAGTGPWSIVFRFTTIITLPSAPILVSPPNGAMNVGFTPLLDWRDDITVITYQLQLSQDSLFGTTLIDSTSFSASEILVRSGLLVSQTSYFWRVRTTNSIGTGPWSAVWKFTTALAAPQAPILLSPPNGAIEISTTPTLDWNDVPFANTYRVQVSTDSNFASFVFNIGGLTASQFNVPGGTLQNNTTYYWRVNATNGAGTSPYSTVWRFTTVISPPVAAPVLLSPPNGSTVTTLTPTLDWNDVFNSNGYKVNLSNDSFFNTVLIDTTVTLSNYTVRSGILLQTTNYYWRVRAFNIGGFGPWSVTWRFQTGVIGINILSTNVPKEFKLHNNFPNPFNPNTKINFDIAENSDVEINIFNSLGQLAVQLFRGKLNPAQYQLEWDASERPSGLYFLTIRTEKNYAVKKMILLK